MIQHPSRDTGARPMVLLEYTLEAEIHNALQEGAEIPECPGVVLRTEQKEGSVWERGGDVFIM